MDHKTLISALRKEELAGWTEGLTVLFKGAADTLEAQARDIEALRADAERYRWLREQHWTDKTLCVIRPADLPLGVQTFSLVFLDDAIRVRRMSEAGGRE